MTPALSVIIPHRNAKHLLSRMLESILRQSLKDLEVIIVDGLSDESCADVVESFGNKGLAVSLVAGRERLYTQNARLLGLEHAKGDIIAFADAGDILWGKENLEHHVDLYRATGADILQFRCAYLDENAQYAGMHPGNPLAKTLSGPDIFSSYLQGEMFGICTHLYARQSWLHLITRIHPLPVRHHFEDLCLLLFYYYHAQAYTGSMHIGYGYIMDEERTRTFMPAAEKAMGCHALLKLFPEYLREQGTDMQTIDLLTAKLRYFLHTQIGRASIAYARMPEQLNLDMVPDVDIFTLLASVSDGLSANAHKLREIQKAIFAFLPWSQE